MFAQCYWLTTAPGLLPFTHSSHTDGETEARSSKASSEGGEQSQAWQRQEPSPPSSPLAAAPCCLTSCGLCHTSRKMSPPLKGVRRPPRGACVAWRESCRKSCEVGAGHFPGKAGLQPQKPFPCRLEPFSPCHKQLLCTS